MRKLKPIETPSNTLQDFSNCRLGLATGHYWVVKIITCLPGKMTGEKGYSKWSSMLNGLCSNIIHRHSYIASETG